MMDGFAYRIGGKLYKAEELYAKQDTTRHIYLGDGGRGSGYFKVSMSGVVSKASKASATVLTLASIFASLSTLLFGAMWGRNYTGWSFSSSRRSKNTSSRHN